MGFPAYPLPCQGSQAALGNWISWSYSVGKKKGVSGGFRTQISAFTVLSLPQYVWEFGSGEIYPEVLRGNIFFLLLQLRGCMCGGRLPLGWKELLLFSLKLFEQILFFIFLIYFYFYFFCQARDKGQGNFRAFL